MEIFDSLWKIAKLPGFLALFLAVAFYLSLPTASEMRADEDGTVRLFGYLLPIALTWCVAVVAYRTVEKAIFGISYVLGYTNQGRVDRKLRRKEGRIFSDRSVSAKNILCDILKGQQYYEHPKSFDLQLQIQDVVDELCLAGLVDAHKTEMGNIRVTFRREYWGLLHGEGKKWLFKGRHKPSRYKKTDFASM